MSKKKTPASDVETIEDSDWEITPISPVEGVLAVAVKGPHEGKAFKGDAESVALAIADLP